MKKRLSLHRETLTNLNPDALTAAGAGPDSQACSFTVCTGCVTKYRNDCIVWVTDNNSCMC